VSDKAQFRIRAQPIEKAAAVVNEHWAYTLADGSDALLIDAQEEDTPIIVRKLVEHDIRVYEVSPQRQTLEDYFLSVTEGENSHVG
jgi:ABC-2 type transport system ATP-binding protein